MSGPSDPGFDTLALHAGASPDPSTGASAGRAVTAPLSTSTMNSCWSAVNATRRTA